MPSTQTTTCQPAPAASSFTATHTCSEQVALTPRACSHTQPVVTMGAQCAVTLLLLPSAHADNPARSSRRQRRAAWSTHPSSTLGPGLLQQLHPIHKRPRGSRLRSPITTCRGAVCFTGILSFHTHAHSSNYSDILPTVIISYENNEV